MITVKEKNKARKELGSYSLMGCAILDEEVREDLLRRWYLSKDLSEERSIKLDIIPAAFLAYY